MSLGLAGARVAVTGASGFVGAAVVRALAEAGADVTAMVRPASDLARLVDLEGRVAFARADLLDLDGLTRALRRARPDFVVHAAVAGGHGATPEDASDLLASAVLGTHNLLRALDGLHLRRVVNAGSSLEYGPRSRRLREDDELRPTTLRGVAKAAATLLLQQHAVATGLPVVSLRVFSAYGPWEQPDRLIPTAARALLEGVPLRLTRRGIRRDFVFVEDVASALVAALTADVACPLTVNVGTGVETTNEEVVALLQEISGRTLDVLEGAFPERPVDTEHWAADVSRAKELLGWEPSRPLRDGLAETFRWWEAKLLERRAR